MSTRKALERIDHVGIAVKSINEARKFYEGQLGAKFVPTSIHHTGEFKLGIFDLDGFCLERLVPIDPRGFPHSLYRETRRRSASHHTAISRS